jgi:hypothetical protein
VTEADRVLRFRLYQNFPNPFNPITHLSFLLAHPSHVALTVLDVTGREVAVLLDGRLPAGTHEVEWDGGGNSSGVYFCRFQSGEGIQVEKMILLK